MLGVALRTLFADLDNIPEHDRSDYESALHLELAELAEVARPHRHRFAFVDIANSLTGFGKAFKAMRLSHPSFEGVVDEIGESRLAVFRDDFANRCLCWASHLWSLIK